MLEVASKKRMQVNLVSQKEVYVDKNPYFSKLRALQSQCD